MWPYVAGAVVALGGLWKVIAVLRCDKKDIPDVVSAMTSMFTLNLPWTKKSAAPPDQGSAAPPLPPGASPPPGLPPGSQPPQPTGR